MRVIFSSGANRDIKKTLEYYSIEAGVDIAMDLYADLDSLINRIKQWPESFPSSNQTFRKAVLRNFSYQVIYRIESAGSIRILAIRHHRQHPDFGLDR